MTAHKAGDRMILNFDKVRPVLDAQYTEIPWDISSGNSPAELENSVLELEKELAGHTKSYIKSKTFELICRKGQIADTMATPDGRHKGAPNSKNLCAVTAMDRNGITVLIGTVTKMDHSDFPNGSVLDFVLHPSAVVGEDGLDAFYAILMTYFSKGGFAMHGNVFSADDLKKAQAYPEKYSNLQVRVCGWNVYFVNLSKTEQDAFIRQAENAF